MNELHQCVSWGVGGAVGQGRRRAVVCLCGHKDVTVVLFARALKGHSTKLQKNAFICIVQFLYSIKCTADHFNM